jgi:uncharacterized membrane protein YjjP (DUF1212 family)
MARDPPSAPKLGATSAPPSSPPQLQFDVHRTVEMLLNIDLDLKEVPARALLTDLGLALYKAGMPTHWIEDGLIRAGQGLMVPLRVFCLPTELLIKFLRNGDQLASTVSERPTSGLDVHQMHQLDDLCEVLSSGMLTVPAARLRLDAATSGPPLFNRFMTLAAFSLSALSPVLLFFGGAPIDGAIACFISLLVGLLDAAGTTRPRLARLQNFIAGAGAGFIARTASTFLTTCAIPVALGGVIWYLPGLSVTIAMCVST